MCIRDRCKVASGIDSQVLGEQEIFGQFKQSLKNAKNIKILKGKLLQISNKVIEISKKARTETDIGLNSLSINGLALKLLSNIFEHPNQQNVLVLGAGYMGINLMQNLYKQGITNIKSVNRSIKKIQISNDYEIFSSTLDTLNDELEYSDILIASCITELPLVGKGAIENALKKRSNKPILIIDLGVPRNIEDEIREIVSAKTLKFLSIKGLYNAMGFEDRSENYPQLTDHYFTGDYPVKIIDELGEDKVTQLSLLSTGSNN